MTSEWAGRARQRASFAVTIVAVAFVVTCGDPDVDCSLVDPFPWAITAMAVSAGTGDTLRDGVTGETRDTTGQARAMIVLTGGTLAAEIPAGTYAVEIQADGFVPWDTSGVRTRDPGPCGGFVPVELLAPLTPQL